MLDSGVSEKDDLGRGVNGVFVSDCDFIVAHTFVSKLSACMSFKCAFVTTSWPPISIRLLPTIPIQCFTRGAGIVPVTSKILTFLVSIT